MHLTFRDCFLDYHLPTHPSISGHSRQARQGAGEEKKCISMTLRFRFPIRGWCSAEIYSHVNMYIYTCIYIYIDMYDYIHLCSTWDNLRWMHHHRWIAGWISRKYHDGQFRPLTSPKTKSTVKSGQCLDQSNLQNNTSVHCLSKFWA